jgi:hypothetical protein
MFMPEDDDLEAAKRAQVRTKQGSGIIIIGQEIEGSTTLLATENGPN